MIVNYYKTTILPNNSLNPAHPIVIAQVKLQLNYQIQVALPFRLAHICRPKFTCLTLSTMMGSSIHILYIKYYKRPQNYQTSDITLISSINYAIGLLSSFL